MRRIRAVVTGVALVLIGLLAACGPDDDRGDPVTTTSSPTATSPATTSTASSTSPPTSSISTTSSTSSSTTTLGEPSSDNAFTIEVSGGEVDGPDRPEVDGGETVVITVIADVSDEVHLHGYDLFAEVAPGQPAIIEFVADIPGIFELELEGSHQLLLELVVSQ